MITIDKSLQHVPIARRDEALAEALETQPHLNLRSAAFENHHALVFHAWFNLADGERREAMCDRYVFFSVCCQFRFCAQPWLECGSHRSLECNGDIKVTIGLDDTPETQAIWPHSFSLRQEIVIGDTLNLSLITRNTGKDKFTITQAFHTYFKVGDIARAKVLGLTGCDYLEKAGGGNTQKHQAGDVTIDAEVDRIYLNVGNTLTIDDAALNRCIQITSQGSKTAVVWNPWEKIARDMADLEDDDYKRLLCVETTNAADDVQEVAPGGSATFAMMLKLLGRRDALYSVALSIGVALAVAAALRWPLELIGWAL